MFGKSGTDNQFDDMARRRGLIEHHFSRQLGFWAGFLNLQDTAEQRIEAVVTIAIDPVPYIVDWTDCSRPLQQALRTVTLLYRLADRGVHPLVGRFEIRIQETYPVMELCR